MLSEVSVEEIRRLRDRFPERESALLPALWVAQREEGYLSEEALETIADILEIEPSDLTARATFYSMMRTRPPAKYLIQVCRTISCALMGAQSIVGHIGEKLGIGVGEMTEDGRFELITVECLASCGTAPMMQINDDYYENLTPERVDEILDGLP